jgi:hypothetical protein
MIPELPLNKAYEYIHYTKSGVATIDLSRTYTQTAQKLAFHTPNGLWVSVFGNNDWEKYCIKTNTRLKNLKSEFQIFLKPNAKILILNGKDVFENFEEKYSYYAEGIERHGENYTLNLSIAWDRIIADYQGIVVSTILPKLYNMGLWYDTWCCTSGCFWDLQAIEKAEKLS